MKKAAYFVMHMGNELLVGTTPEEVGLWAVDVLRKDGDEVEFTVKFLTDDEIEAFKEML